MNVLHYIMVYLNVSVGVIANLTVWVYNLTYSNVLRDRKSRQFLDLANPFCDDVSNIYIL